MRLIPHAASLFWALLCSLPLLPAQENNTLFEGKKILFLGNSITQNGLYVSLIAYALEQNYPGQTFDITSIGLSSETVSGLTEPDHPFPRPCLSERLDSALALVQPDIVVACYGMNDGIYHPLEAGRTAAYQNGIIQLLEKTKAAGAQLILLTPPPFDPLPVTDRLVDENAPEFGYKHPYRYYDQVLQHYAGWLHTLSPQVLKVVDVHGYISNYVAEKRLTDPSFTLAPDGIHPTPEGHLLMAAAFLNAFGYNKNPALLQHWKEVEEDPVFQAVHLKRQKRSEAWLPFVGYIRGDTVRSLSPQPLLILMGGQSNMAGQGSKAELPEAMTFPPNVRYIDFGYSAGLQRNPQTFGPEISLATELASTYPHQPFILLKYAVGGSSLLDWAPEYAAEKAAITGNPQFGNLFQQFSQKIDSVLATEDALPVCLLWMQGERDARIPEAGQAYYENFTTFLSAFRARKGMAGLPVIYGLVNPPADRYPAWETVQSAQRRIAAEQKASRLIDTGGLSKHADALHYDTEGQLGLGQLFGAQVLKVLREFARQ